MFKNMSLSKKMALGFGTLIVIAGVLGGMTWNGLNRISQTASLGRKGNQCVGTLDKCASLRRDFALRGFAKADGETKNAAEKWRDAHAELGSQLTALANEPGLEESKRALARSAAEKTEAYRGAFDKQADARTNRDKGFEGWSQVGKSVTEDVGNALDTVITPALAAAQQAQNIEALTKWAEISDKLDKDVIQPFLLLRVCAVYFLATNQEEQWTNYQSQLQKVKDGLAAWTPLVRGEAQLEAMVNNFQGYFQRYEAAGAQYHAGVLAERTADAEMGKVAGDIVATMNQLGAGLEGAAAMEAITSQTNRLTMAMALGAVIFGTLLAVVITRSVAKPINRIISGLNDGSDQVNDAAAQVAMASQELAEGASEQASSLEETSSALEEVAAMTRNNAENAKQAHQLSEQAKTAAQEGDRTMNQLNSAMTGINDSSSQISKIIKVIEEIAFQTNLLALNAAVEAARAGEHGKGFAVVADEVRNLAQRAAQASREVTGLIEDSVGRAREGTSVAADVGKVLGTIVGDVTKVATLIDGITKASDEQAQGVEQVNVAVSQMDRVTQQNAAGAEESASAAEELSAQATAVKGIVDELAVVIRGAGAQSKTTHSSLAAASGKKQPKFVQKGLQTEKKAPRSASPAKVVMHASSNAAPPADGGDLSQF